MELPHPARRRPSSYAGTPQRAEVRRIPAEPGPWTVIWSVGGLCWLFVPGTALLWMLPASGTRMGDMYVVTSRARAAQHLLVFLAAALAYRIAIAMGWPASAWARTRVAMANSLLALAVVAVAPVALALVAGFVDGHWVDMHDTLDAWASPSAEWDFWTTSLRFFLPPYVLGLCAIALVRVARRHHGEAVRAAELASAYAAARMAMLSAQLQPHFLFNSLHAISVLIDDSPRQAATMLARLGDFLRHALESSHWPWVDVATELTGLEAYLAVRLCIVVNNSSPQLPRDLQPADYGHGLTNVDLRLRAAYDGDARLTIGPDRQGGTSAFLDLPLRREAGPGLPGAGSA